MTINTSTTEQQDRYFVTIVEDSIGPLLDNSNGCSSNATSCAAPPGSSVSIANLVDPSSNSASEWRPYVILRHHHHHQGDKKGKENATTATICEFQRLSTASAATNNNNSTTTKQQAASNAEFSAFLVAGHIVGKDDNVLYTLTPVDPLFWILQKAATQQSSTRKQEGEDSAPWQPLNQIIDGYFNTGGNSSSSNNNYCLRDSVDRKQLLHVLERIDIGDEEYCYRFSMKKALRWLQRKQEAVQAVLVQQEEQAAANMAEANRLLQQEGRCSGDGESSSNGNGAFSSCFELFSSELKAEENQRPASSNNTTCATSSKDKNDEKVALSQVNETRTKEESVQIVCSYLNDDWTERFLRHLDMSKDLLLSPAELQARKKKGDNKRKLEDPIETQQLPAISQDWNEALQQPVMSSSSDNSNNKSSSSNSKKLKPNPNKMSVAAKRLAKVNKKGMKTLGNFFTAKKKKT